MHGGESGASVVAGVYVGAGGVRSCVEEYSVPDEAMFVYGGAEGTMSSDTTDVYSEADVYSVYSVPSGAEVKCEEIKPEPCGVDDMMTNEAVKVYGEAEGTMSSPSTDVAVRLSCNADKDASKDVFSVCSAPVELW